jgi:hypothetical protein
MGPYIYGTFSGTVDSGYDINNTFGLGVGADLTGQTITGSFEFDPSAFAEQVSNGISALNALGGPVFGFPVMEPPATVTETINGQVVDLRWNWGVLGVCTPKRFDCSRTLDLGDDAARLRWPWLGGISPAPQTSGATSV